MLTVLIILLSGVSYAQSDRYEQRYDLLVSQFGPAGVGISTVLDNWHKVDSTNAKLLLGRFTYYFEKSRSSQIERKSTRKYLGMDPILALKDSTGNDVYYYQVSVFDDVLYGEAIKAADKAVAYHPDKLEFRFMKANAYIAYEKENPDMALACLLALVDENTRRTSSWTYEDEKADQEFFQNAMQEYCYSFYSIASDSSWEAFRTLSEKLSKAFPDNTGYICNVGSYHMIAKEDFKTALKYYNKALKIKPDEYSAIKNAVLASRRLKNVKQEKKYLAMMMQYGTEKDRMLAKARLEALAK